MSLLYAVALLFAVVAPLLQRRYYLLQYIYFLRYPVLLALVLCLMPVASSEGSDLRNLFIVPRSGHQAAVGFFASIAAWVTAYTGGLLWTRLPDRTSLAFPKKPSEKLGAEWRAREAIIEANQQLRADQDPTPVPRLSNGAFFAEGHVLRKHDSLRLVVYLAIGMLPALPLIVQCMRLTPDRVFGFPLGVGAAWVSLFIWVGLIFLWKRKRIPGADLVNRVTDFLARAPGILDGWIFGREEGAVGRTGYEKEEGDFTHTRAAGFAIFTLLIYALGGFLLRPDLPEVVFRDEFPALAYVLALVILMGWVLPWASFQFDKYRVPAELVLIFLVALVYGCSGTDHYYALTVDEKCERKIESGTGISPKDLVCGWKDKENGELPPLIVVTANGGGISAGLWTATVLTRLAEEHGSVFTDSIRLVSTTSGGGFGAMYFVDRYREGPGLGEGADDKEVLAGIREAAGTTSLAAMGWGLLYPDLLRLVFPIRIPESVRDHIPERIRELFSFLDLDDEDRGWALERRWAQRFEEDLEARESTYGPTLAGWAADARAGWRPAVTFNAVLVESGERFAITNVDLVTNALRTDTSRGVRTLQSSWRGSDMPVTTAARLSASFPWVTPFARPLERACSDAYHVGDGGFYDNFGVLGAVEYLRAVGKAYAKAGGKRVVVLQIRAADSGEVADPMPDSGFRLATLGPAIAMLAVRGSSQLARNELDLELLRDALDSDLAIHTPVFELKRDAPLSWHLSDEEKREIEREWNSDHVQLARDEVARVLRLPFGELQNECCDGEKGHGVKIEEPPCDGTPTSQAPKSS